MPAFRRAELWTDWRCVTGATRVRARLPLYAANGDACKGTLAVDSDESLTVVLQRSVAADASMTERQVIALVFDDESFDEWRIAKIVYDRDTATVTCQSPLMDLNDGALLVGSDPDTGEPIYTWGMASATATEVATGILTHDAFVAAGLDAVWSLGTVDSTRILDDVTVTNASPLAAFRALQAAIRGGGEACELRHRRNGTTGYLIDILTEVGASAAEIVLQDGRNLDHVLRTSDTRDQATVVSVLGADIAGSPSGIGLARWLVGTITGAGPYTIPLTDPAGGDGPLVADSQLVGDLLYIEKDATTLAITASDATAQTVTAASIGSLAAGDYVEVRDAAGAQLTALEHPTYVQDPPTGYGRKVGTLTRNGVAGVSNLVPNPVMRTWTTPSAMPDGWYTKKLSVVTFTTSQNTDPLYTELGGASLLAQYAAAEQCVVTPPVPWTKEYADQRMSARARLFIPKTYLIGATPVSQWYGLESALQVRLGIKKTDGSLKMWLDASECTTLVPPESTMTGANVNKVSPDQWLNVDLSGVDITRPSLGTLATTASDGTSYGAVTAADLATPANIAGIVVVVARVNAPNNAYTTHVYIDGVMLTVGSGVPSTFIEYSGANQLWQLSNLLLSERGQPLSTYEATAYDLERKDPTTFAADRLVLGMTVRPRSSAVPTGTRVRITQMEPDYLQPLLTKCTFATPRTRLSDLLLGDSTGTGGLTSGSSGSGTTGGTSASGGSGTGSTGGSTSTSSPDPVVIDHVSGPTFVFVKSTGQQVFVHT